MSRQITVAYQAPPAADIEARVRALEIRVAHLTELVESLTRSTRDRR